MGFAPDYKELFKWNLDTTRFELANTTTGFEEIIDILDHPPTAQGTRQPDVFQNVAFVAAAAMVQANAAAANNAAAERTPTELMLKLTKPYWNYWKRRELRHKCRPLGKRN